MPDRPGLGVRVDLVNLMLMLLMALVIAVLGGAAVTAFIAAHEGEQGDRDVVPEFSEV